MKVREEKEEEEESRWFFSSFMTSVLDTSFTTSYTETEREREFVEMCIRQLGQWKWNEKKNHIYVLSLPQFYFDHHFPPKNTKYPLPFHISLSFPLSYNFFEFHFRYLVISTVNTIKETIISLLCTTYGSHSKNLVKNNCNGNQWRMRSEWWNVRHKDYERYWTWTVHIYICMKSKVVWWLFPFPFIFRIKNYRRMIQLWVQNWRGEKREKIVK